MNHGVQAGHLLCNRVEGRNLRMMPAPGDYQSPQHITGRPARRSLVWRSILAGSCSVAVSSGLISAAGCASLGPRSALHYFTPTRAARWAGWCSGVPSSAVPWPVGPRSAAATGVTDNSHRDRWGCSGRRAPPSSPAKCSAATCSAEPWSGRPGAWSQARPASGHPRGCARSPSRPASLSGGWTEAASSPEASTEVPVADPARAARGCPWAPVERTPGCRRGPSPQRW